jgi:hypothetical protein
MFLSIRAVAFVVAGVDWLIRLFIISCDPFYLTERGKILPDIARVDFSLSILYFGSDDAISLEFYWLAGSIINIIELFIFLTIINTHETEDLDILREENTARNITIISCVALLVKILMYFVIQDLPDEKEEEYTTPGKEGVDDIFAVLANTV